MEILPTNVALPTEGQPIDTIIHVDRSDRSVYPSWVRKLLHPELEIVGPAEYDLITQVELYLHDDQKSINGHITPRDLLEHFRRTDSLKNCLSLHDALEIQKKGVKLCRATFGTHNQVCCWKSAAYSKFDKIRVPYFYSGTGKVTIGWQESKLWFVRGMPAARFVS